MRVFEVFFFLLIIMSLRFIQVLTYSSSVPPFLQNSWSAVWIHIVFRHCSTFWLFSIIANTFFEQSCTCCHPQKGFHLYKSNNTKMWVLILTINLCYACNKLLNLFPVQLCHVSISDIKVQLFHVSISDIKGNKFPCILTDIDYCHYFGYCCCSKRYKVII